MVNVCLVPFLEVCACIEPRLGGEVGRSIMEHVCEKGSRIAAAGARSTAEVQDGKCTSGGVVIAKKVASAVDTIGKNSRKSGRRWTNC